MPYSSCVKFTRVNDEAGVPIRGLWFRGQSYYRQMATGPDRKMRRVRLTARTTEEAVIEMAQLKGTPPTTTFETVTMAFLNRTEHTESASTHRSIRSCLARACREIGLVRVAAITKATLDDYQQRRLAAGVAASTVNTEMAAVSCALEYAYGRGLMSEAPYRMVSRLKVTKTERALITDGDIAMLMGAAVDISFSDYIRLLQYTGAREMEAIRLKWSDVDFERKRLAIGSDGKSKNRQRRFVDFSASLEEHLTHMWATKTGDALFPGEPSRRFRATLERCRVGTGVKGFHDFRHLFISKCVMAGIDTLTIAKWVGHSDGGVLIGKVYGHLTDDHRLNQARKLNFSLT